MLGHLPLVWLDYFDGCNPAGCCFVFFRQYNSDWLMVAAYINVWLIRVTGPHVFPFCGQDDKYTYYAQVHSLVIIFHTISLYNFAMKKGECTIFRHPHPSFIDGAHIVLLLMFKMYI